MQHLVDIPLDGQQFIGLPFPLLVLGVPGVLLYQQGVDLRRQRLGGGECQEKTTSQARAFSRIRTVYSL